MYAPGICCFSKRQSGSLACRVCLLRGYVRNGAAEIVVESEGLDAKLSWAELDYYL